MASKSAKRKSTSSSSQSTPKKVCVTDITRAVDRALRDQEAFSKNIQKYVDAYQLSSQGIADTFASTLRNADEQIEDRQRQLSALDDTIAYETRQGRIKVDQDLAQYGLAEATKLLTAHELVPIHGNELATLRSDLTSAHQDHEEEVQKAVQSAIAKEKSTHAFIIARTKAEAALELAQTKAQLESKNTIIESLNERIARNEDDIRAARELTRQVSEAASRSAVNINTTSGK